MEIWSDNIIDQKLLVVFSILAFIWWYFAVQTIYKLELLPRSYILLCTGTVSYLQMPVFASSSLVPDYKKHKKHNLLL